MTLHCCNYCFSDEFYAVQNILICVRCSTQYVNIPSVINAMPTDVELNRWAYLRWCIEQKILIVGEQEGESNIVSGNEALQDV